MSAELQVDLLRKDFGTGRPAVDDVSFTIAAGEIVVLLGPSGCGKTTTLRCVAGLEHPTAGEIRIGGQVISAPERGVLVPPRLRNFGMVFQSYAVWPHMTVRQNVAYPLKNRGFDRATQNRMVAEALELVSLSAYVDRPVTALSGGQMQRVALARSMVYQPRLLLLDEPLSNLDAQLRLRLRDDLRRIVKVAGLTALYVTHDQAEAVVLGDRIGVMRDGRLLQLCTATELYNAPADPFVATFTGASNRIAGRLVSQAGGFATIEAQTGQVMQATLFGLAVPGAAVSVMIRPENVVLGGGTRDGAARGAEVSGHVLKAHYQGVQTVYALDVLGTRIEAVEMGTAPRYGQGDAVAVCLPPQQCLAYAD
jgi:iron(III) transport system ATP-binding protein